MLPFKRNLKKFTLQLGSVPRSALATMVLFCCCCVDARAEMCLRDMCRSLSGGPWRQSACRLAGVLPRNHGFADGLRARLLEAIRGCTSSSVSAQPALSHYLGQRGCLFKCKRRPQWLWWSPRGRTVRLNAPIVAGCGNVAQIHATKICVKPRATWGHNGPRHWLRHSNWVLMWSVHHRNDQPSWIAMSDSLLKACHFLSQKTRTWWNSWFLCSSGHYTLSGLVVLRVDPVPIPSMVMDRVPF